MLKDKSFEDYQYKRITHWNTIADLSDTKKSWGDYYHRRIIRLYQFLVMPGLRIIEIGCGKGDLLAALEPSYGVGVDFSEAMIEQAKQRYPDLKFICADVYTNHLEDKFDIIILSDLLNDLWDVQVLFEKITQLATPHTRIILSIYSHLWEQLLVLAEHFGLITPKLPQNWLTIEDITNLLYLTNFELINHQQEILWPLSTPALSKLANRYLVKIWPFTILALTHLIVVRPRSQKISLPKEPLVSVIIPTRNEAGNIEQIFKRVPEMGGGTELIFVEGHSQDNTYATIEQAIADHPERKCKLLQQTGKGKGDAVRLGFSQASGDVLMILDADLTVPPEDLPRFYEALLSGKGEFINGVRLVYPMEQEAMRFLNLLANKFFSKAFSWLLGQSIKDTLCGTKVLWKADYERIVANRAYFGNFDPFGDFDLLFGAAKLNLKIVDLPIRYRERTYGATNIQRWRHGWLLLKMVAFAARRIKFI